MHVRALGCWDGVVFWVVRSLCGVDIVPVHPMFGTVSNVGAEVSISARGPSRIRRRRENVELIYINVGNSGHARKVCVCGSRSSSRCHNHTQPQVILDTRGSYCSW